jgi:hypothetical protein
MPPSREQGRSLVTWYGPLTNGPRRGTRGNPKDSDSTGGLIPKREGCAVSVSSPDLRERIGCVQGLVTLIGIGYSIKPNAVPGTSPVLA